MKVSQLRKTVLTNAILIGVALLFFIACSATGQSNDLTDNNIPSSEAGGDMKEPQSTNGGTDGRLVSANAKFGFDLLKELAARDAGKNIFISGSSVGLALAMTYNGAAGETKQEMARVLGLEGMELEEVNRAFAQLSESLDRADEKVKLQIANSLWARQGVTFKPDFMERNKKFFKARVSELNFGDPNAPSSINAWVSENTNGKIEKIVEKITPDNILFLINAIYFKGTWKAEFDKAKTREEDFNLADGGRKKHPMMRQSGNYQYYEDENFQAVSLPYGRGRMSMYVFLPASDSSLKEFQKSLNEENWGSWMSKFEKAKGEIVLPRFKLEYEANLNKPLADMGMNLAFDPDRANLTGMFEGSQNAFISEVRHKTFVEVNEEGTEAAAATSVGISVTSLQPEQKTFRMVVDRPFFCAIRDGESGTVLFMGLIMEPK